ncbi:flavodoxin family protein [Pseudomonas taiwanensis]|uniref:flavodoxin family protein n=1 Tax=Pseudomonas taiwanensis TaxID=470150 RepID=UPI0015C0056D|nr:flavodoxin family protein [Pseudomonas taiwanensis]NWL77000.1 flavodoxin family protein [Pseudomonas taiwanensis]
MKKLAVIYHSAVGHTEHIARQICKGAQGTANTEVLLLKAEDLAGDPGQLLAFDGFILGSPTYFGGVSGVFKTFMDATGPLWRTQQLKGRLAAGFTVSSLAAGDKQSTLMALFVFCMQHGMLWVGNPILPEQHAGVPVEEAANRLGSWSGLMAQSSHSAPADQFAPGDMKTARMFGRNFSETLHRLAGA